MFTILNCPLSITKSTKSNKRFESMLALLGNDALHERIVVACFPDIGPREDPSVKRKRKRSDLSQKLC